MEESKKRKYNEEQYRMLLRCSEKKDMTEWNEWRKNNPDVAIELSGANFKGKPLIGVNLENANLREAHLEKAILGGANLKNAKLTLANLENADLMDAHLGHVDLMAANLKNAKLLEAHLENADLSYAHIENTTLYKANLKNTQLHLASSNGTTLIFQCSIDEKTDFRGVGLDGIRIESDIKELLKYNIRRMNWEDWYKKHTRLQLFVRLFFYVSDYGISTKRLINWFLGLSVFFALIYWYAGVFHYPGIIQGFLELPPSKVSFPFAVSSFMRAFYFSIVTMTTLGFGDMSAMPGSVAGEILLIFHVIIGYVLLGALITRLGILFTAEGPIDKKKFSKYNENTN